MLDARCGDTDTVCLVAAQGKGPKLSYWSKAKFQRKHKALQGKYVFVYRACSHLEAKLIVKREAFSNAVRALAAQLRSADAIADARDERFGEGCHVAMARHDKFDVYCRYSNGYMADVTLPNGTCVVAWRR